MCDVDSDCTPAGMFNPGGVLGQTQKCHTMPQRRLFSMASGFCASVEAFLSLGGGVLGSVWFPVPRRRRRDPLGPLGCVRARSSTRETCLQEETCLKFLVNQTLRGVKVAKGWFLSSHAKSSTIFRVFRCCCNLFRRNHRRFPYFSECVLSLRNSTNLGSHRVSDEKRHDLCSECVSFLEKINNKFWEGHRFSEEK